jgi:phage head maturation protease
MEKKYSYKDSGVSDSLRLQIKDVDGKKGIVTGYFSDFNSIDSDGDIIKPGAFQKSISQNGPQSGKAQDKTFA